MCFKGVRQFQNSEVTDQQKPFCVCIYYGITEFRWGGFVRMYWTQRSEGPCLGGQGYCNDANYCGIDRPGCGGGSYECTGHNGVKGHVWGAGGGTAMTQIIAGLTGQVVWGGFI